MSHGPLRLETPVQAQPEQGLSILCLYPHFTDILLLSIRPAKVPGSLKHGWETVVSVCTFCSWTPKENFHLSCQYEPCHIVLRLHPKSGGFDGVFQCLWASTAFPGGKQQGSSDSMADWCLVEHSQARIEMAYAGHCDFLTGDFNAADESLYVEPMKSCISNKCQNIKICHCEETSDRAYNFWCTSCSGAMCSYVNIDICTHIHRDSSTKEKLSCLLTSLSSCYLCKRINL